ncbi:MAG TPA: GMC family oxidoreductase [Caulobacterales bacterium]|nr:GMC family oxidoreductase [Caulobacterales bacterium]
MGRLALPQNSNAPAATTLGPELEPDVIIVGSGAGGGMAAYVLTKAGVKVLMLEAGRNYDPTSETPMLNWEREAPLRGVGTKDKPFGYYDATVRGGWEIEGEPYTQADENTGFKWWRSRMLGGRTNHWARHVPRFGPYDFKPKTRDGLGVDWPISYEDIAPYYDRTEALIGVSGSNEGLENHPDSSPGILQPPPKPRIHELFVQASANDLGIPCVPSRRAILTRDMPHPHAPRSACYYASPCGRGCAIGAAFQTTTSLLPMALATGKLRIVTNAFVHQVRTNAQGKATGVAYFDYRDGSEHVANARVVILAASACETARILLNSAPHGLANSSGQVGRNLVDTIGVNISAQIPGLEGRPRYNEDGNSQEHLYIPWWLYKEQQAGQLDFPRGYHFEFGGGFGMPSGWFGIRGMEDGYGAPLKEDIRRYYGSHLGMALRGEMIPNDDCYLDLDPDQKDRFGVPVARFHWKWSEHELNQIKHGMETAKQIFEHMGGKLLSKTDRTPEEAIAAGGEIIHEVGTTRMGTDARSSVTNQYGQTWDVNNLIVVDGGIFASNAHKNPTLTIMALAWRCSDELAARMRRHEV